MKKTLLATTAIVALGGAAYAGEVSLSGYAEIGLAGGDAVETQFHDDFDVSFTLSGETDNGLTFGAKIDLDEVSGGISNRGSANAVFVSGAFGTLTMGDTDGALDKAMNDVASGSALADDHSSHAGYSGNSSLDGSTDGQILRYDYAFGGVTLSASVELDDLTITPTPTPPIGDTWSVGGNWAGDFGGTAVSVGLGYQENDIVDLWGISLKAGFGGGFGAVFNYSDADFVGGGSVDHTALGLTYTMDALLLHVNWGEFDGSGGGDADGFGVAVNYDLGGGAVVMLGYGSGDCNAAAVTAGFCAGAVGSSSGNGNGDDTWTVGLGLSF